ncbi:Plasmodium vivax Vir protein, putative, partial [Plasmodium vivax]
CSRLLNSDKFYKTLDVNSPSIKKDDSHCKIISKDTHEYEKIMNVCYKVVNFLINNSEKKKKKKTISCIHCKLLNYWVYEQIKSIYDAVENTDTNVVYGYIKNIMSIIIREKYHSNDQLCHLDPQIPYDENWKAKKEFYEYCYDKDVVKISNVFTGSACTQYQNYLEQKTELYKNFEKILSDTKLNKCTYSKGEGAKCDPKVLLEELIRKKEESAKGHQDASEQNLTGGSSISFLGLPDKRTASTAASVAGVSLLGLALYR